MITILTFNMITVPGDPHPLFSNKKYAFTFQILLKTPPTTIEYKIYLDIMLSHCIAVAIS